MCLFSNLEVQIQTAICLQTFNQWFNANLGGPCCGNIMEGRNPANAALEKIANGNKKNTNCAHNKHESALQPHGNNSCTFRLERLQICRNRNPSRRQSHERQNNWPVPARNRCFRQCLPENTHIPTKPWHPLPNPVAIHASHEACPNAPHPPSIPSTAYTRHPSPPVSGPIAKSDQRRNVWRHVQT